MTVDEITQIAVIGAGLMGHGIAQEFASAGYRVFMHDVTDEQLETARTQIETNLNVLAENAVIQKENIALTLQRIHTHTELSRVAENADFVVEAVTENLVLKQQIFEAIRHNLSTAHNFSEQYDCIDAEPDRCKCET